MDEWVGTQHQNNRGYGLPSNRYRMYKLLLKWHIPDSNQVAGKV